MLEQIERIGILLGVVATILLIFSTAYDYSFLNALNLSFNEIPTNLSDHIRSAIVWLPEALIYILLFAVYEMSMTLMEKGQTENELINNSFFPRFTSLIRKSANYLFALFILLIIILQLFLTNSLQFLYIVAILVWGSVALKIVTHERIGENLSAPIKRIIVTVPMIVFWVGSLGYTNGLRILSITKPKWTITTEDINGQQKIELLGLRRFSDSAVIVDTNRTISVIRNKSIISTEFIYDSDSRETNACRWFNIGCINN